MTLRSIVPVLAALLLGCGDPAPDAPDGGEPDGVVAVLLAPDEWTSLAHGADFPVLGGAVSGAEIDELELRIDDIVVARGPGRPTLSALVVTGLEEPSATSEQGIVTTGDVSFPIVTHTVQTIGLVGAGGEIAHGFAIFESVFQIVEQPDIGGSLALGDVLTIRDSGATIGYYRNGELIHEVADAASPWHVRADLFYSGIVVDATIRNGTLPAEPIVWTDLEAARVMPALDYAWDTVGWDEANPASITVSATAAGGSTMTSAPRTVGVDNTPPRCVSLAPGNGSTVSGEIDLRAIAVEQNISSMFIAIDGDVVYTTENGDGDGDVSTRWDSASVKNGTHVIVAYVYDRVGESDQCESTITVAN